MSNVPPSGFVPPPGLPSFSVPASSGFGAPPAPMAGGFPNVSRLQAMAGGNQYGGGMPANPFGPMTDPSAGQINRYPLAPYIGKFGQLAGTPQTANPNNWSNATPMSAPRSIAPWIGSTGQITGTPTTSNPNNITGATPMTATPGFSPPPSGMARAVMPIMPPPIAPPVTSNPNNITNAAPMSRAAGFMAPGAGGLSVNPSSLGQITGAPATASPNTFAGAAPFSATIGGSGMLPVSNATPYGAGAALSDRRAKRILSLRDILGR